MTTNEKWHSSGTSTKILWGAAIQAMVLTIATWLCAVVFDMDGVRQSLPALVMLISAPAGLAITQFQLSKALNQRHARYLNGGSGEEIPEPPAPPEPPEPPEPGP